MRRELIRSLEMLPSHAMVPTAKRFDSGVESSFGANFRLDVTAIAGSGWLRNEQIEYEDEPETLSHDRP
jgi:hypothetical protein